MADTKSADSIKRTRRVLLSLLAVAAIALLAAVTTPKPTAPKYRRYVSPVLPNGSRVTFLYPVPANILGKMYIDGGNKEFGIYYTNIAKPQNKGDQLLWVIPAWRQFRSKDDFTVGTEAYNVDEPLPVAKKIGNGRSWERSILVSQVTDRNITDVVDAKNNQNGLEYKFQYWHTGTLTRAAPAKNEAVITDGFQVLPPGAAVPAP